MPLAGGKRPMIATKHVTHAVTASAGGAIPPLTGGIFCAQILALASKSWRSSRRKPGTATCPTHTPTDDCKVRFCHQGAQRTQGR